MYVIAGLLQEVLLCFAFTRNLRKLLDTKGSQGIGCLNGIRVISIMWVALGHIYTYNLYSGVGMYIMLSKYNNNVCQNKTRFIIILSISIFCRSLSYFINSLKGT